MYAKVLATIVFTLCLFVAATALQAQSRSPARAAHSPNLRLRISAARTALKPGQTPDIRVTITNLGKKTATLVQPGDGSDVGWRTPLFAWSILAQSHSDGKPYRVLSGDPKATDKSRHLSEPMPEKGARCGNINRLKPDEVFDLAPGQTKEIHARLLFNLAFPGMTYRLIFLYKNVPALKWQGIPLGTHDPKAMERVRNSTPCSLVSNELVFSTPIGAK